MTFAEMVQWAQLGFIFAAVWWASKMNTKVDALHSGFARMQTHAAKIAVLEDRTGGPVRIHEGNGR